MAAVLNRFCDERGIGVPTALFVGLTVFALGGLWAQIGIHDVQLSAYERGREQAVNAAEAGINMAMNQLTTDASYASGSGVLAASAGEFDVTVEAIDTGNPDDIRRKIVATGYAPDRDSESHSVRKLEAEVAVNPTDGFDFALFSEVLPISLGNGAEVDGDVYAANGLDSGNNAEFLGAITTSGGVQLGNDAVVSGSIRADGTVSVGNNSSLQQNVYAGGDVSLADGTTVAGFVQSGGVVNMGNGTSVAGGVAQHSAPPEVETLSVPTFTWNAANYTPNGVTWSSTAAFYASWKADANAGLPFHGHHRIGDADKLVLDAKWKMDNDVTIVTGGDVVIERDITNSTSNVLDLVIISTHANGVEIKNGVTIPDSIRLLVVAPNGKVTINNAKHLTGAVYADEIDAGNEMDVTWAPVLAPGFSWVDASSTHYDVVVHVLREVAV